VAIFRRGPPNAGVDYRTQGVWKNRDVRSHFISEMIQDRGPWLPRKVNRNWYAIYRIVLFPMSLSDLQWISEIFNDTKQGAASLRQLSFLYCTVQDASDELCTDSRVSSQVHNVQFRLAQFRHRYRQLHDDWVVSRRHSGQGTVHHFQTSTSAGGDSRRAIRPRIHVRYYATATTAMLRLALATGDGW